MILLNDPYKKKELLIFQSAFQTNWSSLQVDELCYAASP